MCILRRLLLFMKISRVKVYVQVTILVHKFAIVVFYTELLISPNLVEIDQCMVEFQFITCQQLHDYLKDILE